MNETRIERDSMGELEVPADALYGAQTQRAVNNFPVSGQPMPPAFIHAIARIKLAAARVNGQLGLLDAPRAAAIAAAAEAVIRGEHDDQFPVDLFQTGSGTSSNMNVNEVIARLASREGVEVGPNDHVNMGQSSNDVIPTAIHISAALEVTGRLRPALVHLRETIEARAVELDGVVKTGRTHLMDAMPLRMSQELGAWASQVGQAIERLDGALVRLCRLAQGGTAVGTGINAHPEFAARMAAELSQQTGLAFVPNDSLFASLASQDAAVELSGQLRGLACVIMKIANDLRWMNSGPLAGLGEIELEALQPAGQLQRRRNVNGGGDNVVAGLPHVDVVVGAHLEPLPAGQGGDHLVDVHVAGGAGAGLEHLHGKVLVVLAANHRLSGGGDRLGARRIQLAKLRIDLGRRQLDTGDGVNEGGGHRLPRHLEVVHGALGLGAIEGIGRHLQLSHAVVFLAHLAHGGLLEGGWNQAGWGLGSPWRRRRRPASPRRENEIARQCCSAQTALLLCNATGQVTCSFTPDEPGGSP